MKPSTALIILLLVTAVYGYLLNRYVKGRFYSLVNLCFGVLALLIAQWGGASKADLGFNATNAALVLVAFFLSSTVVLALVITGFKEIKFSHDVGWQLFVRIPLGTALAEELIFRGALMGLLLHSSGRLTALFVSAAAFGLWHLLPGPSKLWAQQNLAHKAVSQKTKLAGAGLFTVGFTFAGGLLFGWLRLFSSGIWLPWSLHTATNVAGWLFSYKPDKVGES